MDLIILSQFNFLLLDTVKNMACMDDNCSSGKVLVTTLQYVVQEVAGPVLT